MGKLLLEKDYTVRRANKKIKGFLIPDSELYPHFLWKMLWVAHHGDRCQEGGNILVWV